MSYELTGLREKVFFDRYARKDEAGKRIEDKPEQMWARVAKAISLNEKSDTQEFWEKKFYDALEGFKFVPGGRILTGAGVDAELTFYNCYVIPSPEDSRGGIFESVRTMVEIMSRGGGVGVNISTLRPRGAYVKGVSGTASGAVSFGGLYSFATGLIIQGGSRRGALMLMLNDDHPDIEEFITVKRTMGLITNANLSIAVSDRFMEAVENDADWDLQWEGKVYKTIKARYLWNLICESAWASGEPGLVFMERYNKESNSWYFEKIICVNPCGEQGLGAWNVCNLGAVNLAAFVNDEGVLDRQALKETVRTSIRFLDDVIDSTPYFFEENKEAQMNIRRTGLGTMGLADALIKSKIVYGSDEAVAWCEDVYGLIRDEAYRMSAEIAEEKGAFPKFDKDKFMQGKFIQRLPDDVQDVIRKNGIRNGLLLTQAPTGTTSILAGVSSGIEPVYDFAFKRKDRLGEHIVYHPLYEEWQKQNPEATDENRPAYFVGAKQLSPLEHVKMQAVAQKYTDSSISKTVNAPNDHTQKEVQDLYMQAYKMGCKGVTYYRDGSRDISVLDSLDDNDKKKEAKKVDAAASAPVEAAASVAAPAAQTTTTAPVPTPRPDVVAGATYKVKTGYGTMYVTINHDEAGKPFEVFATIGKAGGVFQEESEAICRLVSLALRSGISVETVIDQIKGIRGPMPTWTKNGQVLSVPDGIAQILQQHHSSANTQMQLQFAESAKQLVANGMAKENGAAATTPAVTHAETESTTVSVTVTEQKKVSIADTGFAPECPECSATLTLQEGCMTCMSCGYSKCA
jgi:ribonucleoside-diphosphate reductase alpha chain